MYRQRAAELEEKATAARSEEMRRSWLILARDWKMMALDAELRELEAPEAALSPDDTPEEPPPEESLEDALARLAHASANGAA